MTHPPAIYHGDFPFVMITHPTLSCGTISPVADFEMGARAVLVKGGHLKGLTEAVDIFYDGRTELLLSAPFIRGVCTHGTGCTYSAAITGYLALGCRLPHAVELAKRYITQAIARSMRVARHSVLSHFFAGGSVRPQPRLSKRQWPLTPEVRGTHRKAYGTTAR